LKGRNNRHRWLSAIFSCILVVAGMFLFCPPSLFHSRFLGRSYLMERPRFLTAESGEAGRLAVSIQHHGKIHIYVDQDHAKLTPITSGILDADPAWDPTGTRIAYVSLGQRGRLALRVHDLRDRSDSQILEQPLVSQPRWSRDGSTIFFLRSRPDVLDQSTVCAVNLRTRRLSSLAETTYNRPQVWGLLKEDQIVYAYSGAVWIKPLGKQSHRLPNVFTNPCVVSASPNNRLLFVCDSLAARDKLAILVDLQMQQTKQIYRGYIRHVLWSPSGRYLAIASERETVLFRASGTATTTDEWQFVSTLKGIAVCWRSDSGLIFVRPHKGTPYFLEEVDVESKSSTKLAIQVRKS
jgi:hypothetical protein